MSDLSRIRFLESLDSVRFAPPSFGAVPDRDAAMTQAKVECALTLLFGERIVLPEPYSFDSSAVLEFGVDLVSHPSATWSMDPRHPGQNPFVLALLRGHPSYLHAVGTRIANSTFVLSHWRVLQSTSADKPRARENKARLRGEIGAHLKKGAFRSATTAEPSLRDSLKQIKELGRYFTAVPPIPAETARVPLARYFSELEAGTPLRHPDEKEAAWLHCLRTAAAGLRRAGVALADRSSVRLEGQKLVSREAMTQEEFEALCEFCDSCYNSVLHDSSRVARAVYTTPPYEQTRELLTFAQTLSTEIASTLRVGGRAPRTKRGRLSFTVMDEAAALDSPLFRPKALWALLNDGDWRQSVDSLQSAMANGNRLRAEKALDKHLEFLAAAWMGDALRIDREDKPESAFRTEMTSAASVSQTVFAILAEWFTKGLVHSALKIALAAHLVGAAAGAVARKAKKAHAANVLHRSVGLIE